MDRLREWCFLDGIEEVITQPRTPEAKEAFRELSAVAWDQFQEGIANGTMEDFLPAAGELFRFRVCIHAAYHGLPYKGPLS